MNLTPSIVMTSIASRLQVFKPYTHNELHKGGLSLSHYGLVSYRKWVLRVELFLCFGFDLKLTKLNLQWCHEGDIQKIWHCHPFTTNLTVSFKHSNRSTHPIIDAWCSHGHHIYTLGLPTLRWVRPGQSMSSCRSLLPKEFPKMLHQR